MNLEERIKALHEFELALSEEELTYWDIYRHDLFLVVVYGSSFSDLNNLNFVEYQAKKNKPIILSAGASNEDEIRRSVSLIRKYNDKTLLSN